MKKKNQILFFCISTIFAFTSSPAQADVQKDLISSISRQYDGLVEEILKSGEVDVNHVFPERLESFDKGTSVIEIYHPESTPLLAAVVRGNSKITRLLLDYGADTNLMMSNLDSKKIVTTTPLVEASKRGYFEIVTILLSDKYGSRKANVNISDKNKFTPLMAASENGHLEIVNTLLNHDADVNSVDINACSAIDFAASKGHTAIVKLLLENNIQPDLYSAECSRGTALQMAVRGGHSSVVELLLDYGANPNSTCHRYPNSPLKMAVQGGYTKIAQMISKAGGKYESLQYGSLQQF